MSSGEERLAELIAVPRRQRELYPRGGFAGLEPIALQVLVALRLHGDRSVSELASILQLQAASVSHALIALRDAELVTELSDDHDARRRLQRVTAAGRCVVERFAAAAR